MEEYAVTIAVAGVRIKMISDQPMSVGNAFAPFIHEDTPDYTARFFCVEEFPAFPRQPDCRMQSLDVFYGNEKMSVRFRTGKYEPYAMADYDWERGTICVGYLKPWHTMLDSVENGFVHILWELLMLYRSRLILHAACVKTNLGGILFSGPSGIGKSTQAQLWCQVESARLINGDRTVLRRENGVWQAFGSPYAGSSRCYINESCPVRAIVMLKQAPACSIRRLDGMEAFRSIFRGVTASTWDKKSMTLACDLTEAVAAQIPVYELSCTPDAAAVRLLRQTLENEPFQKEDK